VSAYAIGCVAHDFLIQYIRSGFYDKLKKPRPDQWGCVRSGGLPLLLLEPLGGVVQQKHTAPISLVGTKLIEDITLRSRNPAGNSLGTVHVNAACIS